MSIETDKTAKAAGYFLDGAKILLPFAAALWAVYSFSGDAKEERALMHQQINTNIREISEVSGENKALRDQVQANTVTLTEVKTDLKHIKNDTKETLDLVRAYVRPR
jgi:hypothetical protein